MLTRDITDGTGSMGEYEANIYLPRQTISVVRRQMAKLECIPYGYPPPTIEWSKVSHETHRGNHVVTM